MTALDDININLIFSTAEDGRTKDLRYRQRQFQRLHAWLRSHHLEIVAALQEDVGTNVTEAQYFFARTLGELRKSYDSLDLKKELSAEYSVKQGKDNAARTIPHPLIYVIPEGNLLFSNVLTILYTCIAAGSCCMVEIADESRASADILKRLFREALDRSAFIARNERPPTNQLSRFFVVDQSGNAQIDGVQGLLCSETNGVAVAIVDRTADLDNAAQVLSKAWRVCGGKSANSPRKLLVNEFIRDRLCALLCKYVHESSIQATSSPSDTVSTPMSSDKMEATLKGHNFELIEVKNRANLWDRSHSSTSSQVITMLATSSHDDAIDAINASKSETVLALYAFAEPTAAKYLTQFIETRVSFINHIPMSVLGRPAAPKGYPVRPDSLYSRAMLEVASPQYVHARGIDLSLQDLESDKSKILRKAYESAMRPLEPIAQREGGQMNFFSQALVAGIIVYALPVLLVAIGGPVLVVKRVWR